MNKELRIKNKTCSIKTMIHDSLFVIRKSHSAGQALITLLFFSIVAITITSAAVVVTLSQSQTGSTIVLSQETYYLAESGAENALIRLLRDPLYTGENLTLSNDTVNITVTGTNPKTITSSTTTNGIVRKIQIIADYTNSILTVLSWKEIE